MSQEKLTFEQAMAELENIVRKLETGKINLDEAVKAYEKGVSLKQFCENELKQAKLVIEKLILSKDKTTPIGVEPLDDNT